MMLKKIKKYKHMIGEAIRLSNQSQELLLTMIETNKQQDSQTRSRLEQLESQIRTQVEQLDMQIKLQNEITAVNSAAFSEYKNIHVGRDVVIVAAGPSLNKYKPLENAIHIGVNRVYKKKELPLDYHFVQDILNPETFGEGAGSVNCKRFFGLFAITPNGAVEPSESLCARYNATRYYADPSPSKFLYQDIRFHPLMDFHSVVFPALHFALFTNPKMIYLVGCDSTFGGYFTKETQIDPIFLKRTYLYHVLNGFRRLKEFAQQNYPETEIVSINPINLRGLFKDKYTDDQGAFIEKPDLVQEADSLDFSEPQLRNFVDRHIEQRLLDRLHSESFCPQCEYRGFSIAHGLSDANPNKIDVKCNACAFIFSYPQNG